MTLNLDTLTLSRGAHDSPDDGACAMEVVSYLAGEPWSDHPQCASEVIGTFVRTWNDSLPDTDCTRLLKPLAPRLVGTAAGVEVEERRKWMAADWLVREHTPAWLRLAGLDEHADRLAGLPEIRGAADVAAAQPVIGAASDAASDAASGVASGAAWAARGAARAAARGAARAAWGAAWAAWGAAQDAASDAAWAAWGAARGAARAAARGAASDALAATVTMLQESALRLVDRMIAAQ